jgi:hypothetical protein
MTEPVYSPSSEFVQHAHVKGLEGYRDLYRKAAEKPEEFWGELAEKSWRGSPSGRTYSSGIRRSPSGSSAPKPTLPTTASIVT